MFHKVVTIVLKGRKLSVLIFFDSHDGDEGIKLHTMMNEWFLSDFIPMTDRDFAYSLIKHFPVQTVKDRMEAIAYDVGAMAKA